MRGWPAYAIALVVDAARVRALLSRLVQRLAALRNYGAMPRDAYLAAPEKIYASKYLLLTAIEDCLAVANHVIASEAYRATADYADAFTSLGEAGVLSDDLATRLGAMARFRNLLVHEYARVDDARTHELLATDIDDLAEFLRRILEAFGDLRDA